MPSQIKVCMGSSCFARGNAKNLQTIQEFIDKHQLDATIELCGLRCCNNCSKGPNINIDGTEYNNIESGTLLDILEKHYINS
ncbi:MAG: (2Fe-2S) ferredoxin domain-containing protein [Alphaproteobacteria bacterium]|nr:(2Fe-2S) ferredoxin domain-containing protein [Alphaproteobacteria bacterium]